MDITQTTLNLVNEQLDQYFGKEGTYCMYDEETNILSSMFGFVFSLKLYKNKEKNTINTLIRRISDIETKKGKDKQSRINATEKVKSFLENKGFSNSTAYNTSFGFSIDNLFQDGVKTAKGICEELGIDYKKMEYSNAHWVVRVFI